MKSFVSIPLLLMLCPLFFVSYMAWKEESRKTALIEKALEGNHSAIAILAKYDRPWKLDRRIVEEALIDNPYAHQILGIDVRAQR